ncbi:hypothetical protein CWB41_14100 [Methylovirgula ligni]|uniref:Uncharacterized protein n=1 Tax=Methylovirgula ligni TaxID=569860 RepID=A0A3D9YP15_9HYPH|nr:hypothetical protein [Methylovirgula ligni]QAY96724.1 hypothetical protein CWB41_14100 [Methylovirgula ligni]REF83233.1 hypothetical protein DES32_3149 [Methylovirgula ligni]
MRNLFRAGAIALALFCAATLGGCVTLQEFGTGVSEFFGVATGDVVSAKAALVAVNAFDAAEVAGTTYLELPLTGSVHRDATVSATVVKDLTAGIAARKQIEADIVSGDTVVPISLFQTLSAVTPAIQAAVGGSN